MEDSQKQFLDFILACVIDDKKQEAQNMLLNNFAQQSKGNFTKEDLDIFHNEIMKMLKPDKKEEVIAILTQFGDTHVSK